MAANFALFVVPWLILTAASLVIDRSAIPDGLIPASSPCRSYLLSYYCVLLGVAVAANSLAWPTVAILAGNVSVNFFIPLRFPAAVRARRARRSTARPGAATS